MNNITNIETAVDAMAATAVDLQATISQIDELLALIDNGKAENTETRIQKMEKENALYESLGVVQSLGTGLKTFWADFYSGRDYNRSVSAVIEGKDQVVKIKGKNGNAPAQIKAMRAATLHFESKGMNVGEIEAEYNEKTGQITRSRHTVAYGVYKDANKDDLQKTFEEAVRELSKAFRADVKAGDMKTAKEITLEIVRLRELFVSDAE